MMYRFYKIWSPSTDLIYIGCTKLLLCKRLAIHKHDFKIATNKRRCYSGEILKYGDAKIELIEMLNFEDRKEALEHERNIIKITPKVINKYGKENTHEIKEYLKNYREKHKEKAKEYMKEYYEKNKNKWSEKYNKKTREIVA